MFDAERRLMTSAKFCVSHPGQTRSTRTRTCAQTHDAAKAVHVRIRMGEAMYETLNLIMNAGGLQRSVLLRCVHRAQRRSYNFTISLDAGQRFDFKCSGLSRRTIHSLVNPRKKRAFISFTRTCRVQKNLR